MQRIAVLVGAFGLAVSVAASQSVPAAATQETSYSAATLATLDARITGVKWMPDDRLAILDQVGTLWMLDPAPPTAPQVALQLTVCDDSERGLLGVAPSPGYLTDRNVYIYYTRPAPDAPGECVNRVSRFDLDAADPLATEKVLLDNISSLNGNHNGGDIEIDGDQMLWVAIGDAGRDPRQDSGTGGGNDAAQDLSLLNGKLLRITLDGAPAPGNPFTDSDTARCATRGNTPNTPTTTCQEIYAYGLRNPYRIEVASQPGAVYINDVGQKTYEEVNITTGPGQNFGWPLREGPCLQGEVAPCKPDDRFANPLKAYGRDVGTYITAGVVIPGGRWPNQENDLYWFADGGSGKIWSAEETTIDDDTATLDGLNGITDMDVGYDPNGKTVVYAGSVSGTITVIANDAEPTPTSSRPMTFKPVEPYRTFDSTVGAGDIARIKIDGKPDAALVNITLADAAGMGFVRIWPAGSQRPETSTVNVDHPGGAVANAAAVALENGEFLLETTTTARIVVDVLGVFQTDDSGSRFQAIPPTRLVDSRTPPTATNSYLFSDGKMTVPAAAGLPTDGSVTAVVVSVGAIAGSAHVGGYVSGFPIETGPTGTSNVNVVRDDVRANLLVVPVDNQNRFGLELFQVEDVVVDIVGYFTESAGTGGRFRLVETRRFADTRKAPISGRPVDAVTTSHGAVFQNLTVTNTGGPGFAVAVPTPAGTATVSNLNYTEVDQTRAVAAVTPFGTDGIIDYATSDGSDLIIDVIGYFD